MILFNHENSGFAETDNLHKYLRKSYYIRYNKNYYVI